jgi:hypothetical protein
MYWNEVNDDILEKNVFWNFSYYSGQKWLSPCLLSKMLKIWINKIILVSCLVTVECVGFWREER